MFGEKAIRHVRQPKDSHLCVAACAAMIADCTLEDVLAEVHLTPSPGYVDKYHVTMLELFRFLFSRRITLAHVVLSEPTKLISAIMEMYAIGCTPGILCVQSETIPGGLHCVVWDNVRKCVLDPQRDYPRELKEFKVIEWYPFSYWLTDVEDV